MTDAGAFNAALLQRVRELRRASGMTQAAVARAVGVPLGTYQKFEYRSPLPAHLIVPFANTVGVAVSRVLTGQEQESGPVKTACR